MPDMIELYTNANKGIKWDLMKGYLNIFANNYPGEFRRAEAFLALMEKWEQPQFNNTKSIDDVAELLAILEG